MNFFYFFKAFGLPCHGDVYKFGHTTRGYRGLKERGKDHRRRVSTDKISLVGLIKHDAPSVLDSEFARRTSISSHLQGRMPFPVHHQSEWRSGNIEEGFREAVSVGESLGFDQQVLMHPVKTYPIVFWMTDIMFSDSAEESERLKEKVRRAKKYRSPSKLLPEMDTEYVE